MNIINPSANDKQNRQIAIWLFAVAIFIVLMVAVGGLTRLTESGLSITEWKPVHGIIPPMNEADWVAEFELYKQIPEYQQINKGMSLDEFKSIFWWEFIHRLLGRLVGFVFLIPFLYFALTKKLSKKLLIKFSVFFVIGGLQGVVGWYMVKSGLKDRTDVSHYRLAMHLTLALILFVLILTNAFKLWFSTKPLQTGIDPLELKPLKKHIHIFLSLLFLQIIYGAFVAGLNAGMVYNTWPLMDGDFVPAGFAAGGLISFHNDITTIQFVHRWLAIIVFAVAVYLYRKNRAVIAKANLGTAFYLFFVAIFAQIVLGISALLTVVAIPVASAHQIFACALLAITIYIFAKANFIYATNKN